MIENYEIKKKKLDTSDKKVNCIVFESECNNL